MAGGFVALAEVLLYSEEDPSHQNGSLDEAELIPVDFEFDYASTASGCVASDRSNNGRGYAAKQDARVRAIILLRLYSNPP